MRDLVGVVGVFRAENETLEAALAKLRAEYRMLKVELTRLKKLPTAAVQTLKVGDSDATSRGASRRRQRVPSTRRRGSQLAKLTISETVVVKMKAPGLRQKGCEEIVVQDLSLSPTATLYRRVRREAPNRAAVVADLAPGIVGGYGQNLHHLVLMLSTQGQWPASAS